MNFLLKLKLPRGKRIKSENFTKQIAFNLIPHIDAFDQDNFIRRIKMTNETKKILSNDIEVTTTCVESRQNRTLKSSILNLTIFTISKYSRGTNNTPGCKVIDERNDIEYITPFEAEESTQLIFLELEKITPILKQLTQVVSDNF